MIFAIFSITIIIMKTKNLLWIGAIGLGLYYLLKKNKNTNDSPILVETIEPIQPTEPTLIADDMYPPINMDDPIRLPSDDSDDDSRYRRGLFKTYAFETI